MSNRISECCDRCSVAGVGCGEVVLSNRVLGVKVCGGGCDLITSRMLSDWCYAKSCKAMDEGGVLGDR